LFGCCLKYFFLVNIVTKISFIQGEMEGRELREATLGDLEGVEDGFKIF
jgi:hypothetical protein